MPLTIAAESAGVRADELLLQFLSDYSDGLVYRYTKAGELDEEFTPEETFDPLGQAVMGDADSLHEVAEHRLRKEPSSRAVHASLLSPL